eukprot:TRINITY_DN66741_c0_g1_i1.p1 TRINITY_DN66741_c0_g1~~TRINITY_DN66741_c0_g1_i1.p1  ORF type:complete len:320 (+),score=25.44 TRINITY_DN66741_c0_g1_i1:33-992(+)
MATSKKQKSIEFEHTESSSSSSSDHEMRKKRGLKAWCKSIAVGILQTLPPIPVCIWKPFLSFRLGTGTPPEGEQVDYVGPQFGRLGLQRFKLRELPEKPDPGCVRIIIVSDTHERHSSVTIPPGDVLLHCGDILMSSSLAVQSHGEEVLEEFNDWLERQPCAEKVVIGGNHDAALQRLGSDAQEVLSAAVYLQDASYRLPLSGLLVYGNAFSRGTSHNRAWQTDDPEVTRSNCQGADVVMTHEWSPTLEDALRDAGCRPRLWACGHLHASHGARLAGNTVLVNAAIHDTRYRPWQPPVVVDLPKAGIARSQGSLETEWE